MKKFLITLSVTFNILIVSLVTLLLCGKLNHLIMPYFIEPGHARWVSQFELYKPRQGGIVFLGDSITEGGAWEELFPAVTTRNRGISGDTTNGVLARLDQVIALAPEKIFLMIGTNDLGLGEAPEDIARNIGRIASTLNDALPETKLYVQSVLPRGADYRSRVETLNRAIPLQLGAAAHWIDLYPLFLADDGSIDDNFSNDELHLYGAGYQQWREAIAPLVE